MQSPAGKRLADRAAGMLVFPNVINAGADGSVALVEFGAAGEISSHSAQEPIIGFIFSNKGLMYKLTFEGSKMTRLDR